jgi:hypothetical protein
MSKIKKVIYHRTKLMDDGSGGAAWRLAHKSYYRNRSDTGNLKKNVVRYEEGCKDVVKKLALSIFVTRISVTSERWVMYPEDDTKDPQWNIDSLIRTIWSRPIDLCVENGMLRLFKDSRSTSVPTSVMNDHEVSIIDFMVHNSDLFFSKVVRDPSGSVSYAGFMFNTAVEDVLNRTEVLLGVIVKMLYHSMDDTYLAVKDMAVASVAGLVPTGAIGEISIPKKKGGVLVLGGLPGVIAYLRMPIHGILNKFKERVSCGTGTLPAAVGGPGGLYVGEQYRITPGPGGAGVTQPYACAMAAESRVRRDVPGQYVPSTRQSHVVEVLRKNGEIAVNSPMYDLFV